MSHMISHLDVHCIAQYLRYYLYVSIFSSVLLQKKMHYTCRDLLWKPMTFAGPNNYLQLPGFFRKNRLAVKFKFRSWDYTGLLMFTRFADDLGSLELGLSEGQVNVTLMQPGNKRLRFAAGTV